MILDCRAGNDENGERKVPEFQSSEVEFTLNTSELEMILQDADGTLELAMILRDANQGLEAALRGALWLGPPDVTTKQETPSKLLLHLRKIPERFPCSILS